MSKHGRIEDFHSAMREMVEEANLEFNVAQECLAVQNKISMNIRFYDKFTKLWDDLVIEDRSLNSASAQYMKKLAWLIFIVSKIKILKGSEDLTEFVFLLFAVVYQVVTLAPAEVTCKLIESKCGLSAGCITV
jgi:hypothetical protein